MRLFSYRHCEEPFGLAHDELRDEAIQSACPGPTGLPRCARNDGQGNGEVTYKDVHFPLKVYSPKYAKVNP